MRVRLTNEADGAVCLESRYDRDFVDNLKAAIDYGGRQWDPQRKRWIISALYLDVLLAFLQGRGCQVQDDRAPPPSVAARPAMPDDLRAAFDALYLSYTAPLPVADAVFRELSKHYHPDRGGDPDQFRRINDAIAVIRHYCNPKPEAADATTITF